MASYLLFRKNLDRGKDTFYENFQKTENYSKNVTLAWKTLKFGFLYFWKSCRELNILSRNANIESIRILVESQSQNMKQVQMITQIQHHLQLSFKISNGDQYQICSSLSSRHIPFRRNLLKNKLDRETDKKQKNAQKNVTIFSSNLNLIFDRKNIKIWFSLFLAKLQRIKFPFKKH